MSKTIKTLTLIALLTALAACGGSDDLTETETEEDAVADETGTDDAIVDTASDVVTTLADVNGFNIVSETRNPRAEFYGTEVKITAFVKDHSNNWVEDGTVVTFVADDWGGIENQCATVDGRCSVTWVSSGDRSLGHPEAPIDRTSDRTITVMARTIGEDSFIDKNGNSQFDVGELYFTQSEPFIDADDDGVYDAGTDEFDERMDFNGNGIFDEASAFTTFRGESCSAGAIASGHCAEQLEVWDTVSMSASADGAVDITVRDCATDAILATTTTTPDTLSTLTPGTGTTYCIILTDEYGSTPAVSTKLSAELSSADIEVSPKTAVAETGERGGYNTTIRLKSDGIAPTAGTLILTTTSVDDVDLRLEIPVSD